jgi:uncharacterized protein (TIGR03067 family)
MSTRPAILIILLFVGIAAPKFATADERDALVGTWKIVSFLDDGSEKLSRLGVAPAKGDRPERIARLVFTADECYVLRGDGRRDAAQGLTNCAWLEYALPNEAEPRHIDIAGLPGKNGKPRSYLGIYQLRQKQLQLCWPELKGERPTEFKSDGDLNLFVCERISEVPEPPRDEGSAQP